MVSEGNFDAAAFAGSVFGIRDERSFNARALELFHFQYENNALYREFCNLLRAVPARVETTAAIPFLPVQFFRDHEIVTGAPASSGARTFLSSATTGDVPSKHTVKDLHIYERSFTEGFRSFYGDPRQYSFLALLPGYLERPDSSLVYMMDHFIRLTVENGSGFYLHNPAELAEKILRLKREGRKIVLFGVTFALLDLAEHFPMDLEGVIVMETGGMKGRRREMVREELHAVLCDAFHVGAVHSEYGMTELLSQAYSRGGGIFRTPSWMKVTARDVNDPLSPTGTGVTGGLNIIDLANVNSCAFIATQDLGRCYGDGSFEVLGRFDSSDVRGCSLMVT